MSSNGTTEGVPSPRQLVSGAVAPVSASAASTATIAAGVAQEPPESEADGHDSQKKKSAFQITSVVVKSYSEDDNQRQPRSMDDLDDVGTYPAEPGYEPFGNGAAPHSPQQVLAGHDHAASAAVASLHHPAASQHSASAVGRNFVGHAQDPKGSRFVVVKVESKDPYSRGRWRCMDYLDESERGDISVVKSADSSGSSRSSSVNYTHGVDDPLKNPLLLLHSVPEVIAAKLSAAEQQQQQSQQLAPPALTAHATGVDGQLHVQHAASNAVSAPDLMLKTAFSNYVAGGSVNPSASAAVTAVATQAHGVSALSLSGLPTSIGQPKPAITSTVPAAAASLGANAALFSNTTASAAARTAVDGIVGIVGPGSVSVPALHDVYQAPASVVAASAVPASSTSVEPEATIATDGRPSPGIQAGGLPHPVQQLVQPKNAVVIVKPEPLRTMPSAPAPLAMTLGETLGLQVRDEPSASDAQIRETDATTSGVAIDNKIEQAMDLVKSHLMFAVREEVEDLRQQIKELIDEKNRLEYENSVLRAALSPEMLTKLLPPSAQPPQVQQSVLLKTAAVQPQSSL